jgi:hypothetical protein
MAVVKEKDYVSVSEVEKRQWFTVGVFSVIASVAVAVSIYTFNSRISVLEEKTNNLQKTIELYEQKNKEVKQENEKYLKSFVDMKTAVVMNDKNGVIFYE